MNRWRILLTDVKYSKIEKCTYQTCANDGRRRMRPIIRIVKCHKRSLPVCTMQVNWYEGSVITICIQEVDRGLNLELDSTCHTKYVSVME